MKNLKEGTDIAQEIGKADLILLATSYSFSRGLLNLNSQFGRNVTKEATNFQVAISGHLDNRKKSIKNGRFGMAFDPKYRFRGTILGVWQFRYKEDETANHDLMKWSLNIVNYWANDYDRVAIELPGRDTGVDDTLINSYLDRLPDQVMIYRSIPIEERNFDFNSIGRSNGMRLKYAKAESEPVRESAAK